jgi:hypothetical protein
VLLNVDVAVSDGSVCDERFLGESVSRSRHTHKDTGGFIMQRASFALESKRLLKCLHPAIESDVQMNRHQCCFAHAPAEISPNMDLQRCPSEMINAPAPGRNAVVAAACCLHPRLARLPYAPMPVGTDMLACDTIWCRAITLTKTAGT